MSGKTWRVLKYVVGSECPNGQGYDFYPIQAFDYYDAAEDFARTFDGTQSDLHIRKLFIHPSRFTNTEDKQ